jgi:hypothetical protein
VCLWEVLFCANNYIYGTCFNVYGKECVFMSSVSLWEELYS